MCLPPVIPGGAQNPSRLRPLDCAAARLVAARPRALRGERLRPALLDAGGAPGQAAQVVELGAADLTEPHDLDLVEARAIDQERALDANAIRRDAADGEVLVDPPGAAADDHALERLNALAAPLDDLDQRPDGIARPENGDVRPQLLALEI